MRTARILSLFAAPALSLSLAACGGPVGEPINQGDPDDDNTREAFSLPLCRWWSGGLPSQVSQDTMNKLYGINPTPHSEKAYQAGDPSPPIAVSPTYADANGCIVVLDTFLYNKETPTMPRNTPGAYAVHAPRGTGLCQDSGPMPYRQTICNLTPGGAYYIQPLTLNTQAKLLPKNLVP